MPSFASLPISELLRASRDLYTNARDDAEIFPLLAADPWAFTVDDFDAGLGLVAAVEASQRAEATEDLESQEATAAYDAAVQAVREAYLRHRSGARRVYPRGTPVYTALDLRGDAPDDREDLLADAVRFYDAVADRADVIAAVRSLSADGIAAARALIDAARAAGTTQTKEAGDLDRASEQRKAAIDALRRHAALTAADVKEALTDHPQLRERLGLLERS